MNKKGIFFTLLAIVIITMFIGSFMFYIEYSQSRQMDSVDVRVVTMNEFVKSVEADMQRALYISSFRAILSILDQIGTSGIYLHNTNNDFQTMVLNGTLNSVPAPLMQNQTLFNWTTKMKAIARNMDLNLTLDIVNLSIYQRSAWNIEVDSSINLTLHDLKKTASWKKTVSLKTNIDIEGFEDPLYTIGTNGKITRQIIRSNVTRWNITNLRAMLIGKQYRADTYGPSFLNRLMGSTNGTTYGITTLVDTNELLVYGEGVKTKSSVDYIYFGSSNPKNYSVRNITNKDYPDFRLDKNHLDLYNVSRLNYTG